MGRNPKKKGESCKSRLGYGLHVIEGYLREKPQEIQMLYLLPSFRGTAIEALAKQAKVPLRYESSRFFSSLADGAVHQGIAAELAPFPYVPLQVILQNKADLLLVLDEVVDPRNLGALIRVAEAVGVGGVELTKDRSAPLSSIAEKAAVGASVYVPISRVENLARALKEVKEAGYWVMGLAPDARQSLYDIDAPGKVAILLGGEGKGLRALSRKMCDFLVALPMQGKIQSLNVAAAGAVTLYELLRRTLQKNKY
jgi:23S rRNA (guanosine2251-2'-O)-methyltransferase